MKKILIIVLISLLITIAILWWGRSWFSQTISTNTTNTVSQTFFPRAGNTVSNLINSVVDQVTNSISDTTTNQLSNQALSMVIKEPVAFATSITVGTSSAIVYVERSTGHIYHLNELTGETSRLSAATLAPVITATWAQDPTKTYFFIQTSQETSSTWQRIALSTKDLLSTSTPATTDVSSLANNIDAIIPSPDHKSIFILEQTSNKLSGYISKPDGLGRKLVWTNSHLDWQAWWGSPDSLYLATKADSSMPSVVYRLNLKTNNLERLLGGSNGISLLPEQNGERFIYSTTRFGSLSTYLFNSINHQTTVLSAVTMPSKCFWPKGELVWCFVPQFIPVGNYPESWYQGLTSFTDNLQKLNVTSGSNQTIVEPNTLNLAIDGVSPFLDQAKNYLYFVNKIDSKLWRANLQAVF